MQRVTISRIVRAGTISSPPALVLAAKDMYRIAACDESMLFDAKLAKDMYRIAAGDEDLYRKQINAL